MTPYTDRIVNTGLRVVFFWGMCFFFVFGPVGLPWAADNLNGGISELKSEYDGLMNLAGPDRIRGAALGKSAEMWNMVASRQARFYRQQEAQGFLVKAREMYLGNLAQYKQPLVVELAGLNYLYQNVATLAYTLAQSRSDTETLAMIKTTEERIAAVLGQGQVGASALAALSGGVLSMLAAIGGQIVQDENMSDILDAELERRRLVAENIANLDREENDKKILLLYNNYLFGTFSVIQIIGLSLNPELKPRLKELEARLIAVKDSGLEAQGNAAARVVTEGGFLVGPLLGEYGGQRAE